MVRYLLASVVALGLAGAAHAQQYYQGPRSVYDWQSGNQYFVTPKPGGGAHVQGFNFQNGTTWNTDIDRRGNMQGFDGNYNYWQYDNNTKTYQNFGTGTMCIGEGYARTCF